MTGMGRGCGKTRVCGGGRGPGCSRRARCTANRCHRPAIGYEDSACYLPADLFTRQSLLEEILVVLLEAVREAQDLKAVAITDGPELQLGSVAVVILLGNDPARPTSNLIHGSIDALCPAT